MTKKRFSLVTTLAASLCLALACGGDGKGKTKADGGKPTSKAKKGGADGGKKADGDGGGGKKKGDYEGGDVSDGGTISGTVKYAGSEKSNTLKITKDTEACIEDGGDALDLVVADGNLKNAVVWITDIKKGKKFEPADVTVDNLKCRFEPRVSVGWVGANLKAKNSDAVLHNTHLYLKEGNKNLKNIALPQKDQVIDFKIKKPGLMDVKCDAHEWMQGWVLSSPHPYATVSGDDGSFKLEGVPAGDYTVKIWHERLGETEKKVKVEAGGTATVDHEYS